MRRWKAVGLVQDHDDAAHSCCRYQCAEEFPCFLFGRSTAQPVTYFQVCDEPACHRECRTNHTTHNQCGNHAGSAFSPTATITTEASISVISVIPDTGLVPTMAIALAATVVNRNAMPATSRMATMLCNTFPCITSKRRTVRSAGW